MTSLRLIETTEADLDYILKLEAENARYITQNSKEEHLKLIADANIAHIVLKSDRQTSVGFVILAGLAAENRNIEFRRIVIGPKGQGIGRNALRMILVHCFEKLNCHRLWLDVIETNERAIHIYTKEGFHTEAKLRESLIRKGEFKSLIIMSILENEYNNYKVKIK